MAPKPRLIPFQPLCRPLEWLSINELARRFDVDKDAITRAEANLADGEHLTSKKIPPGQDVSGRTSNPAQVELANMATRLPLDRWGELRMDAKYD